MAKIHDKLSPSASVHDSTVHPFSAIPSRGDLQRSAVERPATIYRPIDGDTNAAAGTLAFQPVSRRHRSSPTTSKRYTASNNKASSSKGQFRSLFSSRAGDAPVSVRGRSETLDKLLASQSAGVTIQAHPSTSAAHAFEFSLHPLQLADVFPSTWQMQSLFAAPRHEQAASGLRKDEDFSIVASESAVHLFWPPLKALREIDCARKYLEVGARHLGRGDVLDILIITCGVEGSYEVQEIIATSGEDATHSVVLFRELKSRSGQDFVETWYASGLSSESIVTRATTQPKLAAQIRLSPPASRTTEARQGNEDSVGEKDPLKDIIDEKVIDGEVILRAAQLYTNTELHERLKALGSTASYNSVTKRITNSIRARTKASLLPGENFEAKYRAQRTAFNLRRKQSLAAARTCAAIWAQIPRALKRGRSSSDWYGASKQRKLTLESLQRFEEFEEPERICLNMVNSQDGFTNTQTPTHTALSLPDSIAPTALRRSVRVIRASTKGGLHQRDESDDSNDDNVDWLDSAVSENSGESDAEDGSEFELV